MKYESVNQALEDLRKHQQTVSAYQHAMGVMNVDASTAAPKGSWEGRGQTMGILSEIAYQLDTDPRLDEMLTFLEAHMQELNPQQKRQVEVLRKGFDETRKIPAQEFVEYCVLLNDAQAAWEKAKLENDFDAFAPFLEKIMATNRRFAGYYNPSLAPYDALLDRYEEGLTMAALDPFFEKLRAAIVPLIAKIQQVPQIDDSFLHRHYPVETQRRFSDYLMEVMGIDRSYCTLAETEHPFTSGFNNKDVRITTHYHADDPSASMFSVIHEGGHALYELGGDDCYNFTVLQGGASMGIHESQSRFYENIIGRSRAFIHAIFPRAKELFPEQLADVDEEMFYRAVNKAQPSLIRTMADELTYANHIMIRYEMEKQLIGGTLEVRDVPKEWNRLYKEYLGVEVPNDTVGCLQDTHWASGLVGYFPSYALGSAYGTQMLEKMQADLGDVFADVANGDLSKVTGWLKEHIHRHASFKKPGQLFEEVCGEFDASCFTDYLTKKYTELYNLK